MTDAGVTAKFNTNYLVKDLALCRVTLSRDSRFRWLVVVPNKPDLVELFDLEPSDRALLMEEIAQISRALKAITGADKINVANLGNQVPQLHIHIVARHKTDPGWPGQPWIGGDPVPYAPGVAEAFIGALKARL